MQDHIETLIEVGDELSAVGGTVNKNDQVVFLFVSLPVCYSVLLGDCARGKPKLAVVTE